jgi:hypothetical protein
MHELLSARVGFDLIRGTGWLKPLVKRADWPLGRASLTKNGLCISTSFIGDINVDWQAMSSIQETWAGLRIQYTAEGEPFELEIYAPFLWHRFQACMKANAIAVSGLGSAQQ